MLIIAGNVTTIRNFGVLQHVESVEKQRMTRINVGSKNLCILNARMIFEPILQVNRISRLRHLGAIDEAISGVLRRDCLHRSDIPCPFHAIKTSGQRQTFSKKNAKLKIHRLCSCAIDVQTASLEHLLSF